MVTLENEVKKPVNESSSMICGQIGVKKAKNISSEMKSVRRTEHEYTEHAMISFTFVQSFS